ncbi:DUF5988 family protein [Streptosporangium sp. NPDC050855]|uniref:DUF5988 family protein n=1 Tax=Streptosporangium sp. NPDC050855 TaxID=3366194 RepID=UPI0037A54BC8
MSVSLEQGGQEGGTDVRVHAAAVVPPPAGAYVDITLEGGPADIPRTVRVDDATAAYGKIKVPWGNGYEHFERPVAPPAVALSPVPPVPPVSPMSPVSDVPGPVVFRWTTRTRIAE